MMKKNFFTLPNILTLIRIAIIPVLVYVFFNFYFTKPYLTIIIFVFAAVTDLLDGFIAKRFNMVSDAGKVLDPLADKLFLNTMLLCFVIKGAGLIVTLLLIINMVKELYLISAGTLLYRRKFIISSKFIGKAAAFILNLGIIIYLLIPYYAVFDTVSDILFLIGIVLSLSAAVYYTVTVYKQTGGHLPPKEKGEKND